MNSEAKRIVALARQAAERIQIDHRDLFERLPIRPTHIAKRLGLQTQRSTNIVFDGQYVCQDDLGGSLERILYRDHLSSERGRYVIAHEIGHSAFKRCHNNVSVKEEELFADQFAREIVFPICHRDELRRLLTEEFGTSSFLSTANRFGVYPADLMIFLSRNPEILAGSGCVFILARLRGHPVRIDERDWRVAHTAFDKERCFVPANKRISSFIKLENGLWSDCPQMSWESCHFQVSTRTEESEFSWVEIPTRGSHSNQILVTLK